MASARSAWTQASRKQKILIGAAAVIGLSGLSSLASPGDEPAASIAPFAAIPTGAPTSAAVVATPQPTAAASPSPAPTRTPMPTATVEPTPATPTPKPTDKATPKPLKLAFTKFTSPVSQGANATVSVKTAAGAKCSIDVQYKSGSATAAGLGGKTASSAGNVSWTWKVGGRTTPGDWPVQVDCSKGDQEESISRDLRVQ